MSTKPYPALESYLTRTAPSSVSYLGFLESNRSLVVKIPPLSENWKGLHGAWYSRYLQTSKRLNLPTNGAKVAEEVICFNLADHRAPLDRFYLNPEYRAPYYHIAYSYTLFSKDTRLYWEEVIDERKKAGTIRSKTIDIYQAVGENIGDEIVDECQQSSKRLEKDEQGQSRSRSGADYHSENNVESQDPVSASDYDDSDVSDQEAIDNQEVKEATNDKVEVTKKNKTGPLRLSEANRKEVDEAYKLMDRRYMWKLSSGKVIEDELYKLGRELEFEHAVHSFILDIDDELVADCFTETELREIELTPIPEVPELSDEVNDFLDKFIGKTNLKEIRQLIKELSFGIDYDCEKHHDMDYICLALHALIREIESGKITEANLENWFNCHVWSMVFDHAFENIKAISVIRGESTSVSTATRKNKKTKRKLGDRRKIGRRGDWILRAVGNGDKNEFGAGEADMLLNLMEKIGWNEEARKKIQTVGIIHGGLMMTIAYIDNPMGYICRLRRSDLMEVPDMAEKFESILTILASVLNIKSVVRETIKIVQRSGQTNKSFKSAGLRKRTRNESQHHLSACMSTPKKARVCKVSTERPYPASPCPGSPNADPLI
ncbi:1161_t:CDS:10 [Ambispora leptoticha]|uniref:1161_t:CDS:1 n=1 Tax=Ambispora leptoticha TaxID=144679 RepID=A0A9N9H5F5_9GLOM|nr:1161_t:CDS:10 [Ambispora leptoticha]